MHLSSDSRSSCRRRTLRSSEEGIPRCLHLVSVGTKGLAELRSRCGYCRVDGEDLGFHVLIVIHDLVAVFFACVFVSSTTGGTRRL
jgi:hypothetical protein